MYFKKVYGIDMRERYYAPNVGVSNFPVFIIVTYQDDFRSRVAFTYKGQPIYDNSDL